MKGKLWTVTKIIILTISAFIYGFFMLRLCSGGDPKDMRDIIWTEKTVAAYEAAPEDFRAVGQEQQVFITNDGRFWISNVVWIPSASQLQVTIKYNDSTVKYLKEGLEKVQLEEAIEAEMDTSALPEIVLPEEPFDYSLLDNEGNRYFPSVIVEAEKQNYNYRRLVFDDVDLDAIPTAYIDMYYANAVDYSDVPYGSLMTWNRALPTKDIDVKPPEKDT